MFHLHHHLALMAPTHFKFISPEGVNRRLSFSEPPTWSLLASKLHVFYGISLDSVGVSYIDNNNDEITLSSDEKLQDFYKTSHQAGQVIKFAVVDLHASKKNAGKPRELPSFNPPPPNAPPPNGSSTPTPGSHGPSVSNRRQSYQGLVPGDQPRSQPSKPNAQDLREQVEAAKRIYKAGKERYRQEREGRRQERTAGEHTMRSSATYVQCFPKYICVHQAYRVGSTPVAHAEIPRDNETSSIQLQGMYPEVERPSTPRRSHTHSGHESLRCQEDLTARTVAHITRKLADVGYGLSKS